MVSCEAVTEKYGAPDILVNNAGITKDGGGWMVVCFGSTPPSQDASHKCFIILVVTDTGWG